MTAQNVTVFNWLLAISPILVVLILMVGLRWGGAKAGPVGWLVATLVSILFFGAGPTLLAYSQMNALLLTLYVLYIIWMALVLYNVVNEAGSIKVIGQGVVSLTKDRVLQLLALGWVFSSFLQGVSGFGVPTAVVAPLLIGLGFSPITSVVAATAGHSWSVTFGSIGASFNALIAVSGLSGHVLAPWSAALLGIACFGCGITVAFSYEGLKSVRQSALIILVIGTIMAGTQYIMAISGLWNLAGFFAGMVGLAASVLVSKWTERRRTTLAQAPAPAQASAADPSTDSDPKPMSLWMAVAPYALLVVIVSLAELVTPIHAFLNQVQVNAAFPATQTSLGWVNEAGKGKAISLFGHAGALLAYASLLSYALYHFTGHYKPGALSRILSNAVKSAVSSSIGIASMVGFAIVMEMSGMVNLLAIGLSRTVESAFPFLAPFIGMLGAFMTGSNTNSNVVFGGLQQQTAQILNLPVALILAAQTTGGSIGGMLAPAKIIVGCSTAGLAGKEGQVLRYTILYGTILVAVIGALTWVACQWLQ